MSWIVDEGVIVLPNYRNEINVSYNDYLPWKSKNDIYTNVQYNGEWYNIKSHIHSHPTFGNGTIGISESDKEMAAKVPGGTIYILWKSIAWEVDKTGTIINSTYW